MASRLDLQNKLEKILGSRNVYYQPPESVKMEYPAIVYSKKRPDGKYANNKIYMLTKCYELILIDRKPDNVIADILPMEFELCSYDRTYKSDNLYHDVLTLYY